MITCTGTENGRRITAKDLLPAFFPCLEVENSDLQDHLQKIQIARLTGTSHEKKKALSQWERSLKNGRHDIISDLLDRFAREVTCVMTVLDAFIRNEGVKRTETAATKDESVTRFPNQ